jgi:hypothetical protein
MNVGQLKAMLSAHPDDTPVLLAREDFMGRASFVELRGWSHKELWKTTVEVSNDVLNWWSTEKQCGQGYSGVGRILFSTQQATLVLDSK